MNYKIPIIVFCWIINYSCKRESYKSHLYETIINDYHSKEYTENPNWKNELNESRTNYNVGSGVYIEHYALFPRVSGNLNYEIVVFNSSHNDKYIFPFCDKYYYNITSKYHQDLISEDSCNSYLEEYYEKILQNHILLERHLNYIFQIEPEFHKFSFQNNAQTKLLDNLLQILFENLFNANSITQSNYKELFLKYNYNIRNTEANLIEIKKPFDQKEFINIITNNKRFYLFKQCIFELSFIIEMNKLHVNIKLLNQKAFKYIMF